MAVLAAGLACGLALTQGIRAAEAEKPAAGARQLQVLILVGGHPYDEPGFAKLWSSLSDINAEVWKGGPYTAFDDISHFKYDAILMYNLSSGMTEKQRANFLTLLKQGVGLVVWHHALANCQDWPEFEAIAGGKFWLAAGERKGVKVPGSGTGGGKVKVHVADPNHPITKGVADFEIEDEPYNRQTFCDGIQVLLTTDHPASDKALGWAQQYGGARVFGFQCGHDARVWSNTSFQRVMAQGLRWVAKTAPAEKGK